MKHTLATAALLVAALAIPAYAQRSAADDATQAYCAHVRDIGQIAMHERQQGVPMRDSLAMAIDSALPGVLAALVRTAYTQPRYHNTAMQRASAQAFAHGLYADCIDRFTH